MLSSTSRIEAADSLSLLAGRDIQNIGGDMRAGGDASLQAGRDLVLARQEEVDLYEYQRRRETGYLQNVTQHSASLAAGGNLQLSAGRDVAVIASHVEAGGHLDMVAGETSSSPPPRTNTTSTQTANRVIPGRSSKTTVSLRLRRSS